MFSSLITATNIVKTSSYNLFSGTTSDNQTEQKVIKIVEDGEVIKIVEDGDWDVVDLSDKKLDKKGIQIIHDYKQDKTGNDKGLSPQNDKDQNTIKMVGINYSEIINDDYCDDIENDVLFSEPEEADLPPQSAPIKAPTKAAPKKVATSLEKAKNIISSLKRAQEDLFSYFTLGDHFATSMADKKSDAAKLLFGILVMESDFTKKFEIISLIKENSKDIPIKELNSLLHQEIKNIIKDIPKDITMLNNKRLASIYQQKLEYVEELLEMMPKSKERAEVIEVLYYYRSRCTNKQYEKYIIDTCDQIDRIANDENLPLQKRILACNKLFKDVEEKHARVVEKRTEDKANVYFQDVNHTIKRAKKRVTKTIEQITALENYRRLQKMIRQNDGSIALGLAEYSLNEWKRMNITKQVSSGMGTISDACKAIHKKGFHSYLTSLIPR